MIASSDNSKINRDLAKYIYLERERFFPLGKIFRQIFPNLNNPFLSIKRRPLMIICETVNICNNDCVICAHNKMTRKKETMPLEIFEKVLQDYSDMGGGRLSLTPMIGDIFLDKFLIERLELLSQYPKITGLSVTTNAIGSDIFNDKELKFIIEKFERFHISIYGLDVEEYKIMTRRSYYPRMIKNVKKIIKLSGGKQNILIGFRFLKNHTISDIKKWIQQNFECEIPFNFTNSYSNWGNVLDTQKKLPLDGVWLPTPDNKEQCLIPLFAFQIFSNGNVSFCPCPDYNGIEELKLGNVAKDHLLDIYNSKKCQELWNFNTKVPDFCKKCSFFKPLSELPQYENAVINPLEFIGG